MECGSLETAGTNSGTRASPTHRNPRSTPLPLRRHRHLHVQYVTATGNCSSQVTLLPDSSHSYSPQELQVNTSTDRQTEGALTGPGVAMDLRFPVILPRSSKQTFLTARPRAQNTWGPNTWGARAGPPGLPRGLLVSGLVISTN